ncbi:AAC-rich mRNA clone AAC4 protein [Acanthamoeba castellanii str. Neff]|uniref:AAC-rich mRNA clone AAC4 protein n=1 Tax=Acanthamoeba castellanii (strain ATCC 30010 / Neff) TaxID=1257118 RepID=L8HE90_ACACF|nr:AAC-rich mRNA clone AAC4 protein [Acanthamoeba castellanii str. Neff]ELR23500.1 AAC-rich mRNA clone AAC4 protein [Acanthamoeba castellanii str. Neff]
MIKEPTVNLFTVPNSLTELSSSSLIGRFVRSSLFVHDKVVGFDQVTLTEGGRRIRDLPNAGGNSVASEVMSFEVLRASYGADLLKTEMELEYFPMGGSITDYSVLLYDLHIGVSVTRAMKYNGTFTEEDGLRILRKKLEGVIQSSRLVMDPFHKQVLHIFAEKEYIADVLEDLYNTSPEITDDIKSSTLVIVTVATNSPWIFYNSCGKAR